MPRVTNVAGPTSLRLRQCKNRQRNKKLQMVLPTLLRYYDKNVTPFCLSCSTIGRPLPHPPDRYSNNASEIHPRIYEFHLNDTTAYPQLLRLVRNPKIISSLQAVTNNSKSYLSYTQAAIRLNLPIKFRILLSESWSDWFPVRLSPWAGQLHSPQVIC